MHVGYNGKDIYSKANQTELGTKNFHAYMA